MSDLGNLFNGLDQDRIARQQIVKSLDDLNRNRIASQQKWQQVEKEVDAVVGIFTDTKYSFAQLYTNAFISPFFLNSFLQNREAALSQLVSLYFLCPRANVSIKDKLARILRLAVLEDIPYEIDACEEMLKREEQTLAYANELTAKRKWFDDILILRAGCRVCEDLFPASQDSQRLERLIWQGQGVLIRMDERLTRIRVKFEELADLISDFNKKTNSFLLCLQEFSIASTDDELLDLEQKFNDVLVSISPIENATKFMNSRNRQTVNADIKSFRINIMQILESKFIFISQQLTKDSLSRHELNTLLRYFNNLNRVMNKDIRPLVKYFGQDEGRQLLEGIFLGQIPKLRAAFANAAFALKFKLS